MLLAIDIGNSNIVFGISQKNKWINVWRIHTVATKTSDEYEIIFRSLITGTNVDPKVIQNVVLSSVVPSLNYSFTMMINKFFGIKPVFLEPKLFKKLGIGISNPYQIGSDLVANSVAAHHKFKGNCIIIDMGTALTYTTIDANAKILGVSIAPGLKTAMNSLSTNTAQLPNVEIESPPSVLGRNTIHAIQSGVVLGYIGMIEAMVEKIKKELNGHTYVIVTGGDSKFIYPLLNCITNYEENLTLDGLRFIGNTVED